MVIFFVQSEAIKKPPSGCFVLRGCSALFSSVRGFTSMVREFDRNVTVTILLYTSISFVWLCFDEVFAVWALRSYVKMCSDTQSIVTNN
jgi:hypothetical protein